MDEKKKKGRYQRINKQLEDLFKKSSTVQSRMATFNAVLYNKFDYYFWCGFYLLDKGKLMANSYQGPVACQELAKDSGVCWAALNQKKSLVVPDVDKFPGHIACDSRSKSEVVVPFRNEKGEIIGVLDVDSKDYNSFDETDARELEKLLNLIYKF